MAIAVTRLRGVSLLPEVEDVLQGMPCFVTSWPILKTEGGTVISHDPLWTSGSPRRVIGALEPPSTTSNGR